ncbi:hypothetical protein BGW80DRAFT_1460477 [Lactifluus volemus]|nr:hypothetical protein BGW80DRAFT_1460477 [Lactifluus volemus]
MTHSCAPCANVFAPSSPALSGADAYADDDPSAPSPASSARDYSIPVVYSSEISSDDVTSLPLANSELAGLRGRTGASARLSRTHLARAWSALGLHIAIYVSCELAGGPIKPPSVRHRMMRGHEADLSLTPPRGYVDTLGEPIDPARFDTGIVISSSEEV